MGNKIFAITNTNKEQSLELLASELKILGEAIANSSFRTIIDIDKVLRYCVFTIQFILLLNVFNVDVQFFEACKWV